VSTSKAKRLTLVRHGNAEQDAEVRDFERPLSRKGQNEALEMARRFLERNLVPDLILARRGVVILAELKSDKGRLTLEQIAWQRAIGEHHRLWRPSDLPSIVRELM